ncbi:MAG: SDR family NAD(P)-dependent oxidoreductase [Pseudomonadota bacterium]
MRTIVMTGATAGLGLEAARVLSQDPNIDLIIGARRPDNTPALDAAVPSDRRTMIALDTSDEGSVNAFCADVRARLAGRAIDGLALNAGAQLSGAGAAPTARADANAAEFDTTFATNFLGHVRIVQHLRDLLSTDARVVVTASQSHKPGDRITRLLGYRGAIWTGAAGVARGIGDPAATPAQHARDRYATSKLCCIVWVFAEAQRAEKRRAADGERATVSPIFIAYDPGAVPGTEIARDLSLVKRFGWRRPLRRIAPLLPGFSTPARSGATLARLLSDPACARFAGDYVDYQLRPAILWDAARRVDWQAELMTLVEG